ncbi:MAG: hypothetical protein FWC84_06930 [Alphaproteobacteria bacterium]|nr:hypothetical protein [Alphaproteobacteria bacterium]
MSYSSSRGFMAVLSVALCTLLLLGFPERAAGKAKPHPSATAGDWKKGAKPSQVASFGDWGVFVAQDDKSKNCYALAAPKERLPAKLNRDPAYLFISTRPGDNVRDEVSIIMGFPVKDGSPARAEIGGTGFDLVAKGPNAWIKNQAEEPQFIEALKKGAKLTVKASSPKGNVTTDSYPLAGLAQALDRVAKECS